MRIMNQEKAKKIVKIVNWTRFVILTVFIASMFWVLTHDKADNSGTQMEIVEE